MNIDFIDFSLIIERVMMKIMFKWLMNVLFVVRYVCKNVDMYIL